MPVDPVGAAPSTSASHTLLMQYPLAQSPSAVHAFPNAHAPQVEPPLPYEPIPEPEPQQPSPAAPALPPDPLETDLASKLALRRQQKTSQDHSNRTSPKGP